MKEFEDDKNKGKDKLCWWVGRINMTILPKGIQRFNAIPIKIAVAFFIEPEQIILKDLEQAQNTRITKTILRKKSRTGDTKSPDFILYCKVTVVKTLCHWSKRDRSGAD